MNKRAMPTWLVGMMMTIKAVGKNPYAVFLLGAILGSVFFVLFYGTKVLDPTYIDWLLGGEDLKQHFLGWEFYRSDTWSVPIGAIHQLAYPFGISLTYMDSIPLMAIPFKLFEAILPDQFQYFGIWGLLSYALQGGIAALIIRRWSNNIFVILLSATIFIVNPMMLIRMFSHTALAGHWIVLLAIFIFLERRRMTKMWQFIATWSGVFVLAAAIHPYFLPMVALPFVMAVILTHKKWLLSAVKLVIPPAVGVAFFWLIGGLAVSGTANGLGEYAFNLNALYNPLGWSSYLETLPIASTSGETLNYLGVGVMLLAVVAFALFAYNHRSIGQIKVLFARLTVRHLLVFICVLLLFIAAASPRIQWGTRIIADIDIPGKLEQLWATFRASARLFWVLYYLLVIGVIAYVIRSLHGRRSLVVLLSVMTIATTAQVVDIVGSSNSLNKHAEYMRINRGVRHDLSLLNAWEPFVADKKHMVYLEDMTGDDFFTLADMALKYDMTMNTGYFARSPKEKIMQYQTEQKSLLLQGAANVSQNLYLTKDQTTVWQMAAAGRSVTLVNGFYVVN